MKKNNRVFKNLFLYQTFQKKLIAFVIGINCASMIFYYLGVQRFFQVFIEKGEQLGIPKYHVFYRFIGNLKSEMDVIFLVTTLISLVIITLGSYMVSHKVSGPLYRLREELKRMNQNEEIHPIKFRDGDYIKDIEAEFNSLCAKIKAKTND